MYARLSLFTNVKSFSPKKPVLKRRSPRLLARWLSTNLTAKVAPAGRISDPSQVLEQVLLGSKQMRQSSTVPNEADVLELLKASQQVAEILNNGETNRSTSRTTETKPAETPTSSILGLDEASKESPRPSLPTIISLRQRASSDLTKSLRDLICDPKIYISSSMLVVYTNTQVLLGKPEYIPEIFHLYAHKPLPRPSNSPSSSATGPKHTRYTPSSPRNPKNAIPLALATTALSSAISQKSLPIALSVIDSTVAAPAFRLGKLLRHATIPLAFLALTPFCAYTISTYFGHHYQNTYDPTVATWMCMAGIMAYVGTTAAIGFVALATSNDQMKRVVWRPGTRLRDRWLREEERAAFDRLALAWGFREKWRWGEERGEEWDALREFCGRRGMILDKTDLMEGME